MNNNVNSVKIPFSKSELRVADLLCRGLSEKEIADKLNLSANTVNSHMSNIKEKHGLSKNTEVMLLYISYKNNKQFSLNNIKETGIGIILMFINVC